MSPCRRAIRRRMAELADRLGPLNRVLEVGIAGDDPPGANREFFSAREYVTADRDPALRPDLLLDITGDIPPELRHTFDLVVCSQVLEHVWGIEHGLAGLWTLTRFGGHAIIDLPFLYPEHSEMGGGEDYWRLTPTGLRRLCHQAGFRVLDVAAPDNLIVSAWCAKGLPYGHPS